MTPLDGAQAIADYLAEKFKGYVPMDDATKGNGLTIRTGFLPRTTSAAAKKSGCPAIVVRPLDVTDELDGGSTMHVAILVQTYSGDLDMGHLELYHLLEFIRQALLSEHIIGGVVSLELPLKTTIPAEQAFPVWLGGIEATYTIGQPQGILDALFEK